MRGSAVGRPGREGEQGKRKEAEGRRREGKGPAEKEEKGCASTGRRRKAPQDPDLKAGRRGEVGPARGEGKRTRGPRPH